MTQKKKENEMINKYRLAPTWLYHLEEEPKLFHTQDEVDEAWKNGWFGPPWLAVNAPLISELEWKNKAEMVEAASGDPRYRGLNLNPKMNLSTINDLVLEFEEENEVGRTIRG